jgi:ABC-type uncharacterized transport system involved in gliding motility auxiliary subunit
MKTNRRLQLQLLLQNALFAALLVAAAVLAIFLLKDSKAQWDITQNKRSSLSQPMREVLARMQGPIRITAYATPQDPALGDLRKSIHEFVAPYQLAKPDMSLEFVDPREQPKKTQEANVRSNGELVIQYGERSEHLTNLTEQNMANLLMRLARSREREIMYVDGHGEPKLDGGANFDLGDFGRQLTTKGFRLQGLNLTVAPEVPDNAAVLVITQPRVQMLKGEVDKIGRYVQRGGNVLWLIDQEPLRGLEPLAEQLQLELTPGVAVDPAAARLGIQPTIALSSNYGFHPITEHFGAYNTAFPFARRLEANREAQGWRSTVLVEAAQNGWVEMGSLDGELRLDAQRDIRGPVPVALALERTIEKRDQRVVVVGGSSFLSNAFAGLLSNLDLGINMLNWLAADDELITIQPRARVDSTLTLSQASLNAIGLGFLFALPAALLSAGGAIWWRRRRG